MAAVESMHSRRTRANYRLPPRLFLYTLDQIADMLMVNDVSKLMHFDGRSPGTCPRDRMLAKNIMPIGEKPEWRVDEGEFIRWMRVTNTLPMSR